MIVKLCLKGGCRGWSESTHVKMPHCWKSHALAHRLSKTIVYLPTSGDMLEFGDGVADLSRFSR